MVRRGIIGLVLATIIGTVSKGQAGALAPAAPPPVANGNRTGKSRFVLEALLATFTRDFVTGATGNLLLQSVSPKTTWFSEAPLRMSGHIKTSDVGGEHFYKTKGRPSTWLEKANAAMYASKNNATSKSSPDVFSLNSAPDVSTDGTSWSLNVTYIPSNTDSAFVYKGPQLFQESSQDSSISGALITSYAPISLFIDDICFDYTEKFESINVTSFYQC